MDFEISIHLDFMSYRDHKQITSQQKKTVSFRMFSRHCDLILSDKQKSNRKTRFETFQLLINDKKSPWDFVIAG
jgi:hypothetical protein